MELEAIAEILDKEIRTLAQVEEWGLAASLVTANDPFFTDDYRLNSSNFHSTTLAETGPLGAAFSAWRRGNAAD